MEYDARAVDDTGGFCLGYGIGGLGKRYDETATVGLSELLRLRG